MEWLNGEELLLSVLWAIGYTVKHKTKIPNQYIPFILLAVASALKYLEDSLAGLIFGEAPTLSTAFWAIAYGIQYTFFACGGYEAVRAAKFSWRERRKKEKKMDFKKKPFLLFLLAFVTATVAFFAITMALGSGFFMAFGKITDGWVYGILLLMAYDIYKKTLADKMKPTPTYISMQVLLLINVVSFEFASMTLNRTFSIAGLAVSVFTGVLAGVLPYIVNACKSKRDRNTHNGKEIDEASLQREWSKFRAKLMKLPYDKRQKSLEQFLAFHLIGENIYNGLDVNRPLIVGLDGDKTVALTVALAEKEGAEHGVNAEDIVAAKAYIKSVVD